MDKFFTFPSKTRLFLLVIYPIGCNLIEIYQVKPIPLTLKTLKMWIIFNKDDTAGIKISQKNAPIKLYENL